MKQRLWSPYKKQWGWPSATVGLIHRVRENSTGAVSESLSPHGVCAGELLGIEDVNPFIWDEGNWSCDCNRRYDFMRGLGASAKDIANAPDEPCTEHIFSLEVVNPATGDVIYSDF